MDYRYDAIREMVDGASRHQRELIKAVLRIAGVDKISLLDESKLQDVFKVIYQIRYC